MFVVTGEAVRAFKAQTETRSRYRSASSGEGKERGSDAGAGRGNAAGTAAARTAAAANRRHLRIASIAEGVLSTPARTARARGRRLSRAAFPRPVLRPQVRR